jgi:ribosomal protein S18 acetylase RimI-like enzyme
VKYDIRCASADDLDVLVEFNQAMAAESEDRSLSREVLRAGISHLLAHAAEGHYLLARAQGETVGALMLTFEWSDWRNGRFWWIQSVYVRPAWRRRGVYSALHAYVRDAARADPECCGLRLYVEVDNHGAMATYRQLGMRETDYRLYEEDFGAT